MRCLSFQPWQGYTGVHLQRSFSIRICVHFLCMHVWTFPFLRYILVQANLRSGFLAPAATNLTPPSILQESLKKEGTWRSGGSQNHGYLLGVPVIMTYKDCSILGSILGFPYLGKRLSPHGRNRLHQTNFCFM